MTIPTTGYWTFFNNPKEWEVDKKLKEEGQISSYRVSHTLEKFNPGEMGVLRVGPDKRSIKARGKKERLKAGIYAIVQILGPSPDTRSTKGKRGIRYKVIQNCLNNPVLLETLKANQRFKDKYILNFLMVDRLKHYGYDYFKRSILSYFIMPLLIILPMDLEKQWFRIFNDNKTRNPKTLLRNILFYFIRCTYFFSLYKKIITGLKFSGKFIS